MEYSAADISEMQGLMRGTADTAAQIEILAQIYGGSADDICDALGIPYLPLELTPNMIRHGWTEQTLITIRRMFRAGHGTREIADAVGLSEHAIDGFFSRHRGIFPERNGKCQNPKKYSYRRITDDDVAKMRQLLRDGWNVTDIAEEIGCGQTTVYRRLFGKAKEKKPLTMSAHRKRQRLVFEDSISHQYYTMNFKENQEFNENK